MLGQKWRVVKALLVEELVEEGIAKLGKRDFFRGGG
jgi:hypothetical protein